tara:strand:+ start:54 stop:1025 length:972 start_codon:yes stop_codon:yes gene_type:complete
MNTDFINQIFQCNSEKKFNELALQAFDFQKEKNLIYKQYITLIGRTNTPKDYYDIPFLPIELFKTKKIICENQKVETIFKSSGTEGEKSQHFIANCSIYKQSFLTCFNYFYSNIEDYYILALLPSYKEQKNSSLIYMIDELIKKSKHKESGYYLKNYEELASTLEKLEKKGKKTILFGVTYALLDFAKSFPLKIKNTIILETGGMKGKRKELPKEEVHDRLKTAFQIKNIHSEYGMTELLSQAYSKGNNIFKTPKWMRVLIRDINDPLSTNKKSGGLNIIDLANIFSCPFIATQDMGRLYHNNSFSISGRINNADIRGCNLLV